MTLTHYIMSYVYTPLQFWITRPRLDAGKKVSKKATATAEGFAQMIAFPTVLTLGLAGVWHGAGLLHGTYLTINHAWRVFMPKESAAKRLMTVPVSVGLTFLCVVVGEVMFRAYSFHDALTVYGDMLGRHGMGQRWPMLQIVSTVAMLAVVWLMPNTQEILGEVPHDEERNWSLMPELRWRPTLGWMLTSSAAFVMSMVYSTANSTFLYFQF